MDVAIGILIATHMIGWAIVLGGSLVSIRDPKIPTGLLHGALTALIAGAFAAFLAIAANDGGGPDHVKLAVKFMIALIITGLVWWGGRREKVERSFVILIAALTVVNIFIAVLWR